MTVPACLNKVLVLNSQIAFDKWELQTLTDITSQQLKNGFHVALTADKIKITFGSTDGFAGESSSRFVWKDISSSMYTLVKHEVPLKQT